MLYVLVRVLINAGATSPFFVASVCCLLPALLFFLCQDNTNSSSQLNDVALSLYLMEMMSSVVGRGHRLKRSGAAGRKARYMLWRKGAQQAVYFAFDHGPYLFYRSYSQPDVFQYVYIHKYILKKIILIVRYHVLST